ncbi:MAG: hypothetical protein IPJ66_14950 [Bacteroidetes bacterium]|nr:hypothetical protein [Bacteroidota bacterium]
MKQKIHVLSKDSPLSIRTSVKNYLSEEVTITATRMDGEMVSLTAIRIRKNWRRKISDRIYPSAEHDAFACCALPTQGTVSVIRTAHPWKRRSRINVTLNGIPLNDPESHQV